jgi:hypothetical protein
MPVARPDRLSALDLARLLAVVGMMAAHTVLPFLGPSGRLVDGFPSTLFAVLAGASALLAGRRWAGRPLAATVALATRGLLVVAIGALLGPVPSPAMVVLVYLGVAMVVASGLIHLPTRVLVAFAALATLAGPFVTSAVRDAQGLDTLGELSWGSPGGFLTSVLFTGAYPVMTWIVYLTAGIVLARTLLRARADGPDAVRRWGVRAALGGIAVVAVTATVSVLYRTQVAAPDLVARLGIDRDLADLLLTSASFGTSAGRTWTSVLVATPHSGNVADVLLTGAGAVAVIAVLVLVETARPAVLGALRPLTRAGAAPLTVYVLHVVALAVLLRVVPAWAGGSATAAWLVLLGNVAGALLVGAVTGGLGRRGPLEALVSGGARLAAERVPR